tara:strand:- start:996 stop:1778 length:783 start_codon:yes stop_codon:yes gene_type:complete
LPIDQLFELGIQNDKNIEGKLSITFDDGYVNIFANILDELIKLNIPVTMFLIGNMFNNKIFWRNKIIYLLNNETSLIKFIEQYNKKNNFKINKNFFYQQSKSEKVNSIKLDRSLDKFFIDNNLVHELNASIITDKNLLIKNKLITYGNHTYNHYVLSSLSYDEQKEEIQKNKKLLDSLNLNLSKVFAIPFGGNADYNLDTLKVLRDLNISNVLLCNNKLNTNLNTCKNLNFLDRLITGNNLNKMKFKLIKDNFKFNINCL